MSMKAFGPCTVRRARKKRRASDDIDEPLAVPSDREVLEGHHGEFPLVYVGGDAMLDDSEIEGEVVPSSRGRESYPHVRFITDPDTGYRSTPPDDTSHPEVASRMFGWEGDDLKRDPNPGATAVLRAFDIPGEVH